MSLIIGLILAIVFLNGWWRVVAVVPFAIIEALELSIWLRLRKKRATTGIEAFAGAHGKALTACRPKGRVVVRGQTWTAQCRAGVDAGVDVEVVDVEGLTLHVRPTADHDPSPGSRSAGSIARSSDPGPR